MVLSQGQQGVAHARATVLVVEDEALIRFMIAEELRLADWMVFEAGGYAEAVRILESGLYLPLVFSDICMPGAHNGFDLARTVALRFPATRCILTSAFSPEEVLVDVPFIEKPYLPGRVVELLKAQLEELDRKLEVWAAGSSPPR